MNQNPEKYYVITENWSLDPNQWSMLIDGIAVLLAIFGVLLAFILYKKQRKDSSKDAYDFFQSSLPELKESIIGAIEDLKEFNQSLDLDNFVNPVLSASLNDKFLNKISLVDLNRFYARNRKDKLVDFRNFLIDSNFFGDYQAYISKEINYFQTNYLKKKSDYSQWKFLRSQPFFSKIAKDNENLDSKELYSNWSTSLNQNKSIFYLNDQEQPVKVKSKKALVNKIEHLAQDILPFVPFSEKANEVNLIANEVVSAYADMTGMKAKIREVLEKDIAKFEKVLSNLNNLLE